MKERDWNNYCMRKYGQSIRNKIFEAYLPFIRASVLKTTYKPDNNLKENKIESDN